ncbi:GNAT family N-acetyltransferase [Micromonospora sp. CPCC 206061]|uniref:GNAT family N-acetyltransferase n=1 Tax=Micromonospora sp. CPCC 206061 TaxID=3122410 RepID=UPI002FF28C7D
MPRLQDGMAGWIAEAGRCGYDHIGELPHRIYENLRGRRPVGEVVQVWEDGGEIAGLAINGRFGEAFDVLAAPALRGTDAEREMLRTAAVTTAALTTGQYVATDLFECDATRIRLLTALGFTHFRTWDHVNEVDLTAPVPEPRVPDGYAVRAARMSDADGLAEARNESFGDDWTGERYRSEFMMKPGYDPDQEIVVEAPDGRIAAFTICWVDPRNRSGHFEPVGTHRDFQRRGLARAAMLWGMRRMAERGITMASVNHNAENVPARKLYESIGFTRRFETYGFRRETAAIKADCTDQGQTHADQRSNHVRLPLIDGKGGER